MPTIMSHAVAALAISAPFGRSISWRVRLLGVIGAMAPDADVIGFRFGIHYGDMLGHRGLSHSLIVAVALAALFTFRLSFAEPKANRWRVWLFLFLATASHGVLDAFTDGGLGVAFFAPFDNTRYFFPVTPIAVSPIGAGFFSTRGLHVIANEMMWVWLPSIVFAGATIVLRKSIIRPSEKSAAEA
jgi:inner membrane protein